MGAAKRAARKVRKTSKAASAKEKAFGTPYDDVFRTMSLKLPSLVIPLINEIFGENYPRNTQIVNVSSKFFEEMGGDTKTRETDSYYEVDGKKVYHIECQSTQDGTMVFRIVEYDSLIMARRMEDNALFFQDETGGTFPYRIVMEMPASAVVFLRITKNTPDYYEVVIRTPASGRDKEVQEVCYHVPVLKMPLYTTEDLLKKDLVFLFPFHIFAFEKKLENANEAEHKAVMEEIKTAYQKLDEYLKQKNNTGELDEYQTSIIREMAIKTSEALMGKESESAQEVKNYMGGKVLVCEADKILDKGRADAFIEMYLDGDISAEKGAARLNISVDDFIKLADNKCEKA